MPRKKLFVSLASIAIILLLLFLWRGGHWLVVEAPLQQADAIVMLLGSNPVETHGRASLQREGYAPLLIMAEFRVHNHELIETHGLTAPRGIDNSLSVLEQLGVPEENIRIVPGDISSTRCRDARPCVSTGAKNTT